MAYHNISRKLRSKAVLAMTLLASFTASFGQTTAVPSQYQSLYSSVQSNLNTFSGTIHSSWNGTKYPVEYAAQLLSATSEDGTALLQPGRMTEVDLELTEFQALGIKAIDVHINFPTLYAPYYSDQTQYQQMLNFYTQVASDIRGRGLKLIVETQVEKTNPVTGTFAAQSFLKTLSWTAYQSARAQNCATIAQYIHPDFMSVILEPDSEAAYSGHPEANTVSGSVQLGNTILAAIQSTGATGIQLGAGAGTWQQSLTSFLNAYAAMPFQYLDVHIYPINRSYMQNALTAADIAHQAGKQIAMSECWLDKIADSDLGTSNWTAVEAQNVFSFWAPLDSQFLQVVSDMANYKQFVFVAPFWTNYFFAYMPYATAVPTENQAFQQAQSAEKKGAFSSTGLAFEKTILGGPDTTAPRVPVPPAFSKTSGGLSVSWPADSDNVGVAGYQIYRNNVLIVTTAATNFVDNTAKSGTSYSYAVSAFDAAGNVSPKSATVLSPK